MKPYHIAIVGATGLVGRELLKILEQRRFPMASIHLYAQDRVTGKKLFVGHQEVEVKELGSDSFKKIDIAFFCSSSEVSRHYSPIAAESGSLVIDDSDAFRMESEIPLIVPEVNPQDFKGQRGIIANPSCITTQLALTMFPLHKIDPIRRLFVSTYQSVSSSGVAAMEELTTQTKAVIDGQSTIPHVYTHQIAFNLLPEIDVFLANGYTREEWKVVEETRKLMHTPDMAITVTCVRVPVYIGHSASVNVEFERPMAPDEARFILAHAPGIKVIDDPNVSLYPQPWTAAGADDVFIGRIRADASNPNGLALWTVADNLRKGAALNAVQIAEEAMKQGYL